MLCRFVIKWAYSACEKWFSIWHSSLGWFQWQISHIVTWIAFIVSWLAYNCWVSECTWVVNAMMASISCTLKPSSVYFSHSATDNCSWPSPPTNYIYIIMWFTYKSTTWSCIYQCLCRCIQSIVEFLNLHPFWQFMVGASLE